MNPSALNSRKIDSRLFLEQNPRATQNAFTSDSKGTGLEKYVLNKVKDTIKRLNLSAVL